SVDSRTHDGSGVDRSGALLLVSLDDLRRPGAGGARVETRLAQRAALAQQVPALVERDLQGLQPSPFVVGRGPARLSLPELMLLGDELLDRPLDLPIVHHTSMGLGSRLASPRRSTQVVSRIVTRTIRSAPQRRQRATVPGARR